MQILSLNLALQPSRIPGHRKQQQARIEWLLEMINRSSDDVPDVLCFQELYRPYDRQVAEKLQMDYPYQYYDGRKGKWLVGVHSGLAIFSKIPISNPSIHDYSVYRGVENFARKGLMHVRLENGIDLWTTHLQSGIGSEPCICKLFDRNKLSSDELKTRQLQELVRELRYYGPEENHVLVGDMNIRATSELYSDVMQPMMQEELFMWDCFDPNQSVQEQNTTVVDKADRRIDQCWTNMDGDEIYSVIDDTFPHVSDHHAIRVYLDL